jgi:hypothetical protein
LEEEQQLEKAHCSSIASEQARRRSLPIINSDETM